MQNEIVIKVIVICCVLVALWPYVCLSYLTELKKISKELLGIKKELKSIAAESVKKEGEDNGRAT